jgi:hypothetical protein
VEKLETVPPAPATNKEKRLAKKKTVHGRKEAPFRDSPGRKEATSRDTHDESDEMDVWKISK